MNDGGAAFPCYLPKGIEGSFTSPGMSLRDYFADQALTGVVANQNYLTDISAKVAYEFADALLKAREEKR